MIYTTHIFFFNVQLNKVKMQNINIVCKYNVYLIKTNICINTFFLLSIKNKFGLRFKDSKIYYNFI